MTITHHFDDLDIFSIFHTTLLPPDSTLFLCFMTSHQSIILGLTGGIACGKSETGRILVTEGFSVLDTDCVAHDVMKAGMSVFEQVVEKFGDRVIGVDGELDRSVLGSIVFADPVARDALNRMVHPAVFETVEKWKAEQSGDVAVMIPLLFEAGWVQGWDAVVCVSANEKTVFQRLEKRGLTPEEARLRIAAQMPLRDKEEKSDFIIRNNESLDELRLEIRAVLERIRNQRNIDE